MNRLGSLVGAVFQQPARAIVLRPLRWRAIERRVKAAARHIEDAAQQAKRVFKSHRVHERVSLQRGYMRCRTV